MQRHGFRLAPMAGPLKAMLMAGGLDHADVYGDRKETPNDILGGQTPRLAMQTLGTEWGRGTIHPDIWVNMWAAAYRRNAVEGGYTPLQPVVVDDVRFDNEVEMLRGLGGIIVEVCRSGFNYSTAHRSEKGVGIVDAKITNNGNIQDLTRKVDRLLRMVFDSE